MALDLDQIRNSFPALAIRDDGRPRIYFDNPGGTQVSRRVLDRMHRALVESNANRGGHFRTSQETDALIGEAHRAMADLLNAASEREVVFGPNMTTLTFALSRSLAAQWEPGDEVIVTRMDHDANIAPWLHVAADRGLVVRWLDFHPETYRYDLDALDELLSERTRLVAVCHASNALGTINDIAAISRRAHDAGALVFVDAVQYVPHAPTDVQALGCDFLTCSAYKFFGPHQGILWGREELLASIPAYKVRPASDAPPERFETGTQSHEGQAGTLGAVEYLEWIGRAIGNGSADADVQESTTELQGRTGGLHDLAPGSADVQGSTTGLQGRRRTLHTAMTAIAAYEQTLSAHLIQGLQALPGVTIHGITDLDRLEERVPTVAFTMKGRQPEEIARQLGDAGIFVWHGHYYAVEVVRRLGLESRGGMLRVGPAHYNTIGEIDRLLEVLTAIS
jgi:cysteine desulfurase family protein (TIGR01976 family)